MNANAATASSREELPILLRRLPAIGVTVGTGAVGVAMILVSAHTYPNHAWVSGVLANLGSTLVLFVPLLTLSTLFGRRWVRSERRRDAQVQQLAEQVSAVRRDVDAALYEISERSVDRLAADRAPQLALLDAVVSAPTAPGIADALRLAEGLGILSVRGPRVGIFDTSLYARWELDEDDSGAVRVTVERADGRPLRTLTWTASETAEQFGYAVGRVLQDAGHYPGDIAFHPAKMFQDLHRLLELGYRAETGAGGVVDPIGPILQLTGDHWAITDRSLTKTDGYRYRIDLNRLGEMDWDDHLRGRDRIDIGGFREAFDTAEALIKNGHLTPPAPDGF